MNKYPRLFGWTITYKCNFRCPYCFVWRDESDKDLQLSANEWIKIWDSINKKYGSCLINISGGEPTVYPYFFDIVKHLSKNNVCTICTNFSWDPKKLIPNISKYHLKIFATFHPSFMQFDEFYDKVKFAKDYLDNNSVSYVAYPKQIDDIVYYKNELEKIGVNLLVLPLRDEGFIIENNKVKNTDIAKGNKNLNDNEEKKVIIENTCDTNEYRLGTKSPKGKMCRSGMSAVAIWPDGTVNRCTRYRDKVLGNIVDENFKLLDEPSVCEKDLCPIEYRMIIE